ncbi:RluA family pseudouridine synthase [Pseudanabaena sp. PCC 6802]|uniref:RluA family pseudouridine synthase n=1 Tax=Pseudanabaena sp. PCC 6802 TaxID=118173 RepID=UPI000344EE63|nr:RluA family pseudouridine synthase [Pseudanabaena sp. PCC 6802]
MAGQNIELRVLQNEQERLDRYLAEHLDGISRSRVQKLIEQGMVRVNHQVCDDKKVTVKLGDFLLVAIPDVQPISLLPEAMALEILYEDEHLLVINKPVGLVVHPSAGHESGTLVNALLSHCTNLSGINGMQRPGIVHRLDRDTSGALVVAKHDLAHQHLQWQIQAKTARREYLGIVNGAPKTSTGTVDAPIGRHPVDRKKMAAIATGRAAVTHWSVQERLGNYTLVKFDLETGRTHQIRVHAAYMGHAIAGDPVYGKPLKYIDRQALHAWRLTFQHPVTEREIVAIAPLPADFEKFLTYLRQRSR